MFDVSINMVVRNEEHRLKILLPQLRSLFSEIILTDQSSEDKTVEVAKKYCDIVLIDKNHGYCEASRALCQQFSTKKWLLILDADEMLTFEFLSKLDKFISQDEVKAYNLSVLHVVYGENLPYTTVEAINGTFPPRDTSENSKNRIRLVQKDFAIFENKIHTTTTCLGEVRPTYSYADLIHFKTSYEWDSDNKRYDLLKAGLYERKDS
jgi:glycosyltransferase involved in cell wall biosynthesis